MFCPSFEARMEGKRALLLSDLISEYRKCLIDCCEEESYASKYETKRLKQQLIKKYGSTITIANQPGRKTLSQIVYNSSR